MKLRGHGTLIHQQHLWELRLYGGVVAYYGDVRERLAQLGSRSLPSEACSGYSTSWTAQALAGFIPEPDAGFVEVQSQDRAPRWYLSLQELEPLPHGCCLTGQKRRKKGSVFASPRSIENENAAPNRGPLRGPRNANMGGATVATFRRSPNGPSLA